LRHATPAALDQLDELLATLRAVPGLREKSRGTFYRGSKAFLHFHEDPAGMFADLRVADAFDRYRVTTKREQAELVRRVRAALTTTSGP